VTQSPVKGTLIGIGIIGALVLTEPAAPLADRAAGEDAAAPLSPTVHPPVARDAAQLWMAPSAADQARAKANPSLVHLQAALRLYADEKYEQALARFSSASASGAPLRAHALYYAGVSELRLQRFDAARKRFANLRGAEGFIGQAAALGEAEAAQALGDYDDAVDIYQDLLKRKPVDAPAIWLSLANAALADGDRGRAAEAFLHVYYEFPLSEHAARAEGPLQTLAEVQQIETGNRRYTLELGRGERLFGSRRYAEARNSFLRLKPHATGGDADLVSLRLAEIDYFQGRHTNASEALRPFLTTGPRQAEARFFYLMSQHGLRNYDTFEQLVHALETDFPDSTWVEEALNNLATFYIQQDRDDEADSVFRTLYERFPLGRYAERAAWKAGWASYRKGDMDEAARLFETAAKNFPRSDYRPGWLYWSGRARGSKGDTGGAIDRYQLTIADYHNTYYGRLAEKVLRQQGVTPGAGNLVFARIAARIDGEEDYFPPNETAIRTLLALGLYDAAMNELEFARAKWGDSPGIAATMAWANKQKAASASGTEQFSLARGSITLMRRAYPQFMAGGGHLLPREILTTIYPLSYWDLIKKYAGQHRLDPYLVAALMAQESTFVRDIKSHAGAYGLMQMMPRTGRQYARRLKIPYSLRLLTTPEPNIRMGTMYLADKIREFGSVHLALASYNAGETPVRRWMREFPDLPQDEFIDSIPYPETQLYVKRLLGTAEDYRRLYSPDRQD
jgi:soluble lytic murein transglycosylase